MKICIAQIDVIAGRPDINVNNMLNKIKEAKENKADVIIFGELTISGYILSDLWTNEEFCQELMDYNEDIKEASDGITVIYGNVYMSKQKDFPNKDGRLRKHNCAYIYRNKEKLFSNSVLNGDPSGTVVKTLHPDYRFFDDDRYFVSKIDSILEYDKNALIDDYYGVFKVTSQDGKESLNIGIEICEDIFCKDYLLNGKAINPTRYLIGNGTDLVVNISASPWTYGKSSARNNAILFAKKDIEENGLEFKPFYYVNIVGCQNNGKNYITFDGDSTVYNKEGKVVERLNNEYKEELKYIDTNKELVANKTEVIYGKIGQKYNAIIRGIQHIKDTIGAKEHPKFVCGASGGIDSNLTLALLVKAVGKDKVIALNIPTNDNKKVTRDLAKRVAEKLGIRYEVIPIQELFESADMALSQVFNKATDLNLENEQARTRGSIILPGVAAREGALFTNNGNKLEIALGYCTAQADLQGAIAPLADLTKVEIFELAKYINGVIYKDEVIPNELFPDRLYRFGEGKVASGPELNKSQVSKLKIGYHDYLLDAYMTYNKRGPEFVLERYLEGVLEKALNMPFGIIERYGLNDPVKFMEDIRWFYGLLFRNIWKRIQAPPIIVTSRSAYGYDYRESLLPFYETKKFKELENRILKKYQGCQYVEEKYSEEY